MLLYEPLSTDKILNKRSLELAYIGDAVIELLVREHLLITVNSKKVSLHRQALEFVSATAQSCALENILQELLPDELSVYKRGRNTKSFTVPKNTAVTDYRRATGIEALFGYLFLAKRNDRIKYLFKKMYNIEDEK